MKKSSLALLALAAALAIAPSAKADTFYVSFAGIGVSGSGSLTGPSIAGGFDIQAADITINGMSWNIIGNPTPGALNTSLGWVNYDDILSSTPPPVTNGGLLFENGTTGAYGNLWSVGNQIYWDVSENGAWQINGLNGEEVSMTVSNTPEPGSLLLLATGLLAVAFVVFRKAKSTGPGLAGVA